MGSTQPQRPIMGLPGPSSIGQITQSQGAVRRFLRSMAPGRG